jgi:hypothetical protein
VEARCLKCGEPAESALPDLLRELREARAEAERLRDGLGVLALSAEANGFDALAGLILLFRDGNVKRLKLDERDFRAALSRGTTGGGA